MFIDSRGLVFNDGAHIVNGDRGLQGFGGVGEMLGQVNFEPGLMRPYYDDHGVPCVTINVGYKTDPQTGRKVPKYKKARVVDLMARGIYSPVFNATGLTKDAWIELDTAVIRAARQELRAWADLSASNSRSGFNAMGRATLEYQAMTDPGEAVVDMDAMTDARTDRPVSLLRSIPLPITHSDFWFSARDIAISRNGGMPLDTVMAEAAGRRIAEMVERTLIGTETGISYGTNTAEHTGTSTVYGYTNFPYRVTKTDLTTPLGSNPEAIVQDILEMLETMYANGYNGPFILYHSTPYSIWFNSDYFRSGSTSAVRLLRERIMEIDGIADIRRLNHLTSGYQLILIQMTPDVAQAINGMDITTVQWESQGGMRLNFKVMAIQVPLLRAPYNGVAGIIHGTTS